MSRVLVTGGCGFIGSHLVDALLARGDDVVVLDCLSYGADLGNLPKPVVAGSRVPLPDARCVVVIGDVADRPLVERLAARTDWCAHLASETHVDRSYGDVEPFVSSNVVGAWSVLEAYRKERKRLVLMSTDEVYGDVAEAFSVESDALAPRNVYSAMKASSDILARTYASVFGVDVVVLRPANNYGPRQCSEKLIPHAIKSLLSGNKIPIYGDGGQVRDWLWVGDCVRGILALRERGRSGAAYNLGAGQFRSVLQIVRAVADILGKDWESSVVHVADRVMGDRRYALDWSAARRDAAWEPAVTFEDGIARTVAWYAGRAP